MTKDSGTLTEHVVHYIEPLFSLLTRALVVMCDQRVGVSQHVSACLSVSQHVSACLIVSQRVSAWLLVLSVSASVT